MEASHLTKDEKTKTVRKTRKEEVVVVNLEFWPVIASVIVILIAIATSNRAIRGNVDELRRELGGRVDGMQREMNERFEEVNERIVAVRIEAIEHFKDVDKRFGEVNERIDAVRLEMSERFGEVNNRFGEVNNRFSEVNNRFGELTERLGRLEGLVEGIGYAQRQKDGVRSGEKDHRPMLPRS